jgi:hypothetical protein
MAGHFRTLLALVAAMVCVRGGVDGVRTLGWVEEHGALMRGVRR